MRANFIFVKERVSHFNKLIFGGELPEIRIMISTSGSTLGTFSHPRIKGRPTISDISRCVLRISNRYDLSETEIEDTIIHELIHYYIWLSGIHNETPHGESFMRLMKNINKKFGRNISVRSTKTEEMMDGDD
ncbi:MAG: SprT-like domain-containing protein, partial [Muribaculaceae bacterium]|nr:SprT-like domain-containing protein [Muribaculaceae bacterium]